MVFVDRQAKYPGRWTMKKSDGTSEVVTLIRNDEPTVEGTPMNAETLNTLSDVAGADVARLQAESARDAAASSATEAAGSANAAEKSKAAAATSEANAAKHEEAAKKASEEAGTKAGTDKTLTLEDAPADAKAAGEALDKKADKDVILDEEGNVLFYGKSKVDEMLAGKLDLTGGTMTGKIQIQSSGSDIIALSGDTAGIEMQFVRTDTGAKLAVGVGDGGKNMGLYDISNKKWIIHTDASTGKIYIGGTLCTGFVTASGSNYVRFSDGTQICWERTSEITVNANSTVTQEISYPASFTSTPIISLTIAGNSNNDNYSKLVLHTTSVTTTKFTLYFKNISSGQMAPIAQWLAIGRWK